MVILHAVFVILSVLVVGAGGNWPEAFSRAWLTLRSDRGSGELETIFFEDGPLAGRTDRVPAGPDKLPPMQFCPWVMRADRDGGNYTLPYQRGPIREATRAWSYTQGWSEKGLAQVNIEDWRR